MNKITDPRPKEFLEALNALPASVAAVKRLYATGTDEDKSRLTLAFVAPKKLMFRRVTEDGRTLLQFDTDGKTSVEKRPQDRKTTRKKEFYLPSDTPRLAQILLGGPDLHDFGLGGEGESRTYFVERETWKGMAVVTLRYTGSDTIGRSQAGFLRLDVKTGVPRAVEFYQDTNSPMDHSGYDNLETWTTLQVTR